MIVEHKTGCHIQNIKGFSLVELLVTTVVSMVVLGGLMTSFIQQNSEYKYQNKRIDAVQDLEFALKFIAEDLRSAVMAEDVLTNPALPYDAISNPYLNSRITITNQGATPFQTTRITFDVWGEDLSLWGAAPVADQEARRLAANYRATRRYDYDPVGNSLSYDRSTLAVNMVEILPNVTFFKIFDDSNRPGVTYAGIPTALPQITLKNPDVIVNGYTILIEVEVDAGYKSGSFVDVLGNNVGVAGHKRVWRYIQVYPMASAL